MNSDLIKIAITGPESTGKSDLTRKLAEHFNTTFVKEFAREYIDRLERPYNQQDIVNIAKKQVENEIAESIFASRFLFCDTELLVTHIWSMHKYGTSDPWIMNSLQNQYYDLYLLCDIDLPWAYDEQREHPHQREFFFDWYKRELESRRFSYEVVSGQGEQRFKNALSIITRYFDKSK